MRFARPDILWAMVIILPLLAAFLWWTWRERQKLITQFVHARLLPVLTVGVSRSRQKLRLTLLATVVALTLLALSRPQWGFGYQEVKQRGLDIVVGIDTSRSMLAEDVSPNRLEKAKLAAQDLRRLAKTDRMGLVAFAGSAFLQMPMSLDENAFRQHLNALNTGLLPQGGTALAEAIQTARTAFKEAGEENHRALVLFTDGEDHDGQAIEAAAKAAKEGMVVFTIGMGSPGGELIPVRDAKGRIDFIKDENGNAVKSRLNENLLQDIAKAGNGFYLHLSGANGMDLLYERGLSTLPKRELTAAMMRRYFERFQWFLALAWLLLIVEMFIPEFKAPPRAKVPSPARPAPVASLTLLLLSVAMILTTGNLGASPSSARRDYEAGKFKNALNEYESLLEKKPKDPALNYNAGAAAYQAGRLRNASEHFEAALATQDPKLQQRAYYNLGNTTFKLGEDAGEPAKTQELWQKSINHFESALKLDPQDTDAQHNLKWVQEKLEELKKQQQQQQNSDQNQKDDKKDQDKDKKQDQQNQQDQKQSGDSKDQKEKNQDPSQDDPKKGSPEEKDQDPSKSDPAKQPKPDEQGDQKDSQQQQAKDEAKDQEGKEQPAGQKDRDKQEGKDGKAGQPTDPSDPNSKAGDAQAARPLQMTQREAIRLLEALRSEERLFLPPPPQKPKKNQRHIKDW